MAYETEDHETQYCFPHINSSCIKGQRSRYEYYIMYVLFSLLSAWTVFLNLLVIISISHFKKLHTPTNMIILSLAVTDMFTGLIVMPVQAVKLIESCWYFGKTFCGLFMIIMGLLGSATLSNLVLIAVDRYVAVCHPLLYPQKITTTKTLMTICLCWFCSSTYGTVLSISNGRFDFTLDETDVCYGECSVMISFTWIVTDLFMSLLFPCTLILTLYLRIFYIVHQQVKVINSLIGGKSVAEGSVKRKSESKAAVTLGIIVTIHLLCWLPLYIVSLAGNPITSSSIVNVLTWVYYINSGLNPLIYALFYSWFRRSAKHILSLKIFQSASSLVDIFTNHHP